MAQAIAGEIITLTIDSKRVRAKVEDASKSDTILAKVEESESADYTPGQVCEFSRALIL